MTSVGKANTARRRARGSANVRRRARMANSAAKKSDPNTPTCEPKNSNSAVGRNDEGGQRHAGQAGIGDSRPESGAPVVEPGRGPVHEKRGGSVQQRRREADRELAVAE